MAIKGCPVHANLVDHTDLRVIQSRDGAGFPFSRSIAWRCSGLAAGKKLQRHRARQHQALGLVATPMLPRPTKLTMR